MMLDPGAGCSAVLDVCSVCHAAPLSWQLKVTATPPVGLEGKEIALCQCGLSPIMSRSSVESAA